MQNSENQCRTTPCKWLTVSPSHAVMVVLIHSPSDSASLKFSLCENNGWVILQRSTEWQRTCESPSKVRKAYPQQFFFIHTTKLKVSMKYCPSSRNSPCFPLRQQEVCSNVADRRETCLTKNSKQKFFRLYHFKSTFNTAVIFVSFAVLKLH